MQRKSIGFIVMVVCCVGMIPGICLAGPNLLGNGDFTNGTAPWWTTAGVTIAAPNGELQAAITNAGTNPWDVIVGRSAVPVQAGKAYTLRIDARANVAGFQLPIKLQQDGPPYTGYFSATPTLTETMQTFTYTFTAPVDDAGAAFQFQMGGQGLAVITVDNVILEGEAEIVDLLRNGDFTNGLAPWWTTTSVSPSTAGGELCAAILSAGVNPWDAIIGQSGIAITAGKSYTLTLDARASVPGFNLPIKLQEDGGSYTQYFNATPALTGTMQTFTYTFVAPADNASAAFQFQIGGQGPATVCLDNIALQGEGAPVAPDPRNLVRVNQVGYFPNGVKQATIHNLSTTPLTWELVNSAGDVVASGDTTVIGDDPASGEFVHIADFSAYSTPGTDYTLRVGQDVSFPFEIGATLYAHLKYDALAYFYHNRSGIAITMPYAGGTEWTRLAGHLPENVTCFKGVDAEGQSWNGCDYTLNVTGGWYDAGDHGKYVVNGGISVWTLLDQYERATYIPFADAAALADGKMNIPENANGVPDILDEARWQMEFMLAMQVPAGGVVEGQLMEGMAHHKLHDVAWTGLALAPADDPQPRFLYPPSTAATLNLAATAAQAARIWKTKDPAFAQKCLTAAETAWNAALLHPAVYARNNFTGGGPYDDTNVSDEFFWAAAELFITTGKMDYKEQLLNSPFLSVAPTAYEDAMWWGGVAMLGKISLALTPNNLPEAIRTQVQAAIIDAADMYLTAIDLEGYRVPLHVPSYPWGSNSSVLNNMLIMALAYDFTGGPAYLRGVRQGMDYLLGRNPMDKSYVSGYGDRPLENPHHRFWSHQKSAAFPSAPAGAVSGGPNSGIQDPIAQVRLVGCAPQQCYLDDIDSWSTNEVTINWNAPLAWVAAFLDETGNPPWGPGPKPTPSTPPSAVPEPTTAVLIGLGLIGLLAYGRKRRMK